MRKIDNIIIGAGPGGYELAAMLAKTGESVALIERDKLGGTCLNRGCIPTKCLCATASVAAIAKSSSSFGVECGDIKINYADAIRRMQSVVAGLRDGIGHLLSDVEIIIGEATLIGGACVSVNNEELEAAKRLVIATGSKPSLLPISGADLALTSDDILVDNQLPKSVVIIGGGVIGMEFASIFSSLDVETTVLEYCGEILPSFDSEIAKRLRTTLTRRNVTIVTGVAVKRITAVENGQVCVVYDGKRGETSIEAEKAVMSVGRRPVLPKGAESIGLNIDARGFIIVDELMHTNIEKVFAIGDVTGLSMLAHSAIAQARVVVTQDQKAFNKAAVPSIVFTSPEVATVGPTAESLEMSGVEYYEQKRMFASNGKACAIGEPQGFMKLVCRKSDDVLISVSIIGPHAADLIAEATILVVDQVKISDIPQRFIHAHPTISEMFC